MGENLNKAIDWVSRPYPASTLATFRVFFGLAMFIGAIRYILLGWMQEQYVIPGYHFTYYGFGGIVVPPPEILSVMYLILAFSACCVMIGLFYRFSSVAFFVLFTYLELMDKAYYLNHYYFVSLVAFLMCLAPANACFAVDNLIFPKSRSAKVPFWSVGMFRLQIGILYFFAGIAKIHPDWLLEAMPLQIWLEANSGLPVIGRLLAMTETAYLFSWFGMIYDILLPFLLINQHTRFVAYLAVIVFHGLTGYLFPIGVFPLVMIMLTPIFFAPWVHERLLSLLGYANSPSLSPKAPVGWMGKIVLVLLLIHFFVQILLPMRYLCYSSDLFWSEEGFRFSWRVMLMEKAGTTTFYVKDIGDSRETMIDNRMYLNEMQERQMSFQPDMILQFAHFLEAK